MRKGFTLFWVLILLFSSGLLAQQCDTVFAEKPFYNVFKLDSSTWIRHYRNVRFLREGVDQLLLCETNLSMDTLDGREQQSNILTITAYSESSFYKTLLWRIVAKDETPVGVYNGEFYLSLISGCCGAENEFQFYSLKTGRKLFQATAYDFVSGIYSGLYSYLSVRSMNNSIKGKNVVGELTLHYNKTRNSPGKQLKIGITNSINANENDFTPDIIITRKDLPLIKYRDLQKGFQNVNAEYFMILDYYDEYWIAIPFQNEIPLLSKVITSAPSIKVFYTK